MKLDNRKKNQLAAQQHERSQLTTISTKQIRVTDNLFISFIPACSDVNYTNHMCLNKNFTLLFL